MAASELVVSVFTFVPVQIIKMIGTKRRRRGMDFLSKKELMTLCVM